MAEEPVGIVTHFFKGPSVAIIRLAEGSLAVGDKIRVVGHTSDFTETITSMEVDHAKVERAAKGAEVAVKVIERAREHDRVLKITE